MKKLWTLFCAVSLLVWPVIAVPSNRAIETMSRQQFSNQNQENDKKANASFKTAQEVLDKANLPFDIQSLTVPRWRQNLAPVFEQMPEMSSVRYETGPLAGVVLADTLYLPEKVEIAGDLVVLAKYLVFEGSNAVMRGNHNVFLLPINPIRVMGTTLASLRKSRKLKRTALPSWPDIERSIESRGSAKTSVTIDASWYPAKQITRRRSSVTDGSFRTMDDRSGTPGGTGSAGVPGADGWNGANGSPGYSGDCGEQPNGGPGAQGGTGADGGTGGDGGLGGSGGAGGDIYLDLARDDTGTYVEISNGGPGGQGGPGGPGGNGGPGGMGGNGGDGADCDCSQGGQGSGGPGGPGGWGGRGGMGGTGGTGGRGGDSGHIRVSYHCELTANVWTSSEGGSGG
jgi:hypothetical protein